MLGQQKMIMDAILAQLQSLRKNSPHGGQDNSDKGQSGFGKKNKENDGSKDKEEGTDSHQIEETTKDKVLEEFVLTH